MAAQMDVIEDQARRRERVTIRDVAATCGVAISTASNALAGRDCVTEETRQRILDVAKELGYRPSAVARSLRMRRSWTIGLLVGDITNPFFPELVRGAEDAAAAHNYNLILCNTDYRIEKQDAYLRHLRDKQADGVIMASQIAGSAVINEFINDALPFVMINQAFPGIDTDYVGVDNVHGVGVLCDHLWKLGHRRIAFIKGREGSTAAADRFEGFANAMQARAGGVDEALLEQGDYSYVSGATGTRRLLAREHRPTAIVAANDLMALGALEAAAAEGLKVPEDISIVGIDDIFVSSLPSVNLTTLRQPKWELGAAAVRLILDREKSKSAGLKRVMIKPELILRATTGPAYR